MSPAERQARVLRRLPPEQRRELVEVWRERRAQRLGGTEPARDEPRACARSRRSGRAAIPRSAATPERKIAPCREGFPGPCAFVSMSPAAPPESGK